MYARRKSDENPNSSAVAESIKLRADCSYGYQILNRSSHNVEKYLSNEGTHATIRRQLFKKLDYLKNGFNEIELANTQFEHKQPRIVGFFILQYAKLRMLKL